MPNRMLRDWTDSDKINSISVHSERFFTRLIMKVDDYGCFYADTRLLKAHLFPLLLDSVREADLLRWMAECQKAGLIVLYESANKKYLQIIDFRQRLDKARQKYPLPTDNDLREFVIEFPGEVEVEKKPKGSDPPDLSGSNLYRKPKIPPIEEVRRVFIQQGGTVEMAQKFFDSNEGTGWYHKNSPITNFANFVPYFISSWNKFSTRNGIDSDSTLTDNQKKLLKAL